MCSEKNLLQGIHKWNSSAILSAAVGVLLWIVQVQPANAQMPEDPNLGQQTAIQAENSLLQASGQQLGELLNEDGTLNLESGYHGSIDISGYRLISSVEEAPRFAALSSVPGDEKWQPGLNLPGIYGLGILGDVHALAIDSAGNLFAGGSFTAAGGVAASNIAKWNGSSWSPVGSGMNGRVNALVLDNADNLYAGGYFTTAGSATANYIAKWDGSSWTALGAGMNNVVHSLTHEGAGSLYAGGDFTSADGVSNTAHIARWNGSNWEALGSGINHRVTAIVLDGSGILYAGGWFTAAGGLTANRIARWNGSSWSAVGTGVYGLVYTLVHDGAGNLYAGGDFSSAGGASVNNIAKWDGGSWSALGSGMNKEVDALSLDSAGNLYAGGTFLTAGGVIVNYISGWDGSNWFTLGSGMNYAVFALTFDSTGDLYAGGRFDTAGGVTVNNIAKWDGSSWTALGSDLSSIQVVKTATPETLPEPGGAVTFNVTVTNTSMADNVTITTLNDNIHGDLDATGTCAVPQTIVAGDSYSCLFSASVIGNAGYSETDTVTASGADDDSNPVSHSDDATVTITDLPSSIQVVKTATPETLPEPGGSVTFEVTMNNLSIADSVTITSLSDDVHGGLNGQGSCTVPQTILAGGNYSCSFSANVNGSTGDSETDTVTASGTDDDGNPVSHSDSATVTIVIVPPGSISVIKSPMPEKIMEPGGPITFDIKVTNTSFTNRSVILTGLNDDIHGDLNGQGSCAMPQTVEKGSSYSCSFTVDVNGVKGQTETDVVSVIGTDDLGNQLVAEDTATVTIIRKKSLCIPIEDKNGNVAMVCF